MTYEESYCDFTHSLTVTKRDATGVITPNDVIGLADDWTNQEISHLISRLEAIVALRELKENPLFEPKKKSVSGDSEGWIEPRIINGCGPYYYERFYKDGKKCYGRYFGKNKPTIADLASKEAG